MSSMHSDSAMCSAVFFPLCWCGVATWAIGAGGARFNRRMHALHVALASKSRPTVGFGGATGRAVGAILTATGVPLHT